MTKSKETQTEQKQKMTVEAVLTNGMTVSMRQGNGHDVIKARIAAKGGQATTFFLIAELATFDGKKMPAEEILNFELPDIFTLEELWGKLAAGKSQPQET